MGGDGSVVGFMVRLGALCFDLSVSCSLIKQTRRHYIILMPSQQRLNLFPCLEYFLMVHDDQPTFPVHKAL